MTVLKNMIRTVSMEMTGRKLSLLQRLLRRKAVHEILLATSMPLVSQDSSSITICEYNRD